MWNKQDYEYYTKTDEMDKINIIYDYLFEEDHEIKNEETLFPDVKYEETDSLILYKDLETLLIFGNKQSEEKHIIMYKEYLTKFIMNGFIIESKELENEDFDFVDSLNDEALKKNFTLIKKYVVIHSSLFNIITDN